MGVKRVICSGARINEEMDRLVREGYNRFGIYLSGSNVHTAKGLNPAEVLIRAWRR